MTEREPSAEEAAAESAANDGVSRLVWSSLRREALLRPAHDAAPRLTLLELHASYFQRDHARTHAALARAAAALRAIDAPGVQARAARSCHA